MPAIVADAPAEQRVIVADHNETDDPASIEPRKGSSQPDYIISTTTTPANTLLVRTEENLPNPVTPESPKNGDKKQQNNVHPIRRMMVSTDTEPLHSPDRSTKSTSHRRSRDDEASSSDDDSYFATHLPAPNSRGSFSLASTGSYQQHYSSSSQNNNRREKDTESNASLSFSDDESDDDVSGVHIAPTTTTTKLIEMQHLLPKRITRMHSVSSLISSASSEEHNAHARRPSVGSVSSHTTLSEAADFQNFLESELYHQATPSGRRSPVMGTAPQYFFPPSTREGALRSPPPPISVQAPPSGVLHPKPQPAPTIQDWGSYGAMLTYHGVTGMPLPVNQLSGVGSSGSGLANRNAGGRSLQQEDSTNPGRSGSYNNLMGANENSSFVSSSKIASAGTGGGGYPGTRSGSRPKNGFKVYWRRWLMLFYMSLLNLLSDWTCYSVAPIALLTEEAFGSVDPERLVVVFLGANAIASACEPIILARLGLRKTVLFGALLLMIGSLVKSGGIPPIIPTDLVIGQEGWRLYLGFFLVGLSQPLYQCTPALLSASWFPEKERTMATGVALNANQLGIGFAFIFGTLLVSKPEDIPNYFGLLTLVSTIAFLGTLIQFDDAPPTPPSASARVMRGSIEINLPSIDSIVQSVRGMGGPERPSAPIRTTPGIVPSPIVPPPSPAESRQVDTDNKRRSKTDKTRKRSGTRKRGKGSSSNIVAPSPALSERTSEVISHIDVMKSEARMYASAPSPAMSGRVGGDGDSNNDNDTSEESGLNSPPHMGEAEIHPRYEGGFPPPGGAYPSPYGAFPPYQYPPYWDPLVQQQIQEQHAAAYQQQLYYFQQQQHASHQTPPPYYYHDPYPSQLPRHDWQHTTLPAADAMDEGAEPTIIMTPNHLDIDIRDDQVLLSIRACLSRPGFLHALVAFTVSGIVINTLSTYMDYLVGLNGAPRYYTGVVGGTFQFLIMISSLIIGKQTDKTRAYYSVTIGMLVLGAFGLAECGVSLDENNGRDLRWSLLIVAVLVGPLQPVSTELGVDVAYPLSENTVLVIQQLFSNLLSALFIPVFKALKNVGTTSDEMDERPEYTFSFYLLIVLHTGATIFFATFNGRYLRYEHEVQKKAEDEREKFQSMLESGEPQAFHPFYADHQGNFNLSFDDERRPLVS